MKELLVDPLILTIFSATPFNAPIAQKVGELIEKHNKVVLLLEEIFGSHPTSEEVVDVEIEDDIIYPIVVVHDET